MNNAKVAIFEDFEPIRTMLGEAVTRDGHTVAVSTACINEARQVIENMEDGDLDVAVVDGNLEKGKTDGSNGAEIAALLRSRLGSITIIGFSAGDEVAGADLNPGKDVFGVIEIIADL